MEEQLRADFDRVVKSLKLSDKNIELRKKNLNEFIKNGFPNKRKEDWKFFDLNQIIKSNIKNLNFFNNISTPTKNDETIYIKNFEHNKIIFVNGSISLIDFGYEEKNKIEIEKDLNLTQKNDQTNILISLNNALLSNYIKISVKKNYSLNKPLVIYNFTNKELNSMVVNLRTDIILEKNSSLKLITLSNDNSKDNFININQNFKIAKDAILKNYKIDSVDNSNIKYFFNNIDLEHNSFLETFIFSKASKFIKK